jgi:hypothetical protein
MYHKIFKLHSEHKFGYRHKKFVSGLLSMSRNSHVNRSKSKEKLIPSILCKVLLTQFRSVDMELSCFS